MPKYNYEFYCRSNNDDFHMMTSHEYDIIEHNFTPKKGDIVIDVEGTYWSLYIKNC